MQRRKDWQSHNMNGVLLKSALVVIFWLKELLPRMVHGIWKNDIPRTSRTITKVTNNLKELANTINMR